MAKAKRKKKSDKGYRFVVSTARRIFSTLLLALVLLLLVVFGRTAYRLSYNVFHQTAVSPEPGKQVVVMIPPDATVREIATILSNAGLIEDTQLFMWQERFSAYHTSDGSAYQNGQYRLSTAMTPNEILAVLAGEAEELDAQS